MAKKALPHIPDVRALVHADPILIDAITALKEHIEVLHGKRGSEDDAAVLVGDLAKIGIDKKALNTNRPTYNLKILERGRFEADGSWWESQDIEPTNIRVPASGGPTWTTVGDYELLAFSGSAQNDIYFFIKLPNSYMYGTDINLYIHYEPEDGTSGNVRWDVSYSMAAVDGTFPSSSTDTKTAASSAVASSNNLLSIVSIDGSAIESMSNIIKCKLSRRGDHADDTYDGKAIYLLGISPHIRRDSSGSYRELARQLSI